MFALGFYFFNIRFYVFFVLYNFYVQNTNETNRLSANSYKP